MGGGGDRSGRKSEDFLSVSTQLLGLEETEAANSGRVGSSAWSHRVCNNGSIAVYGVCFETICVPIQLMFCYLLNAYLQRRERRCHSGYLSFAALSPHPVCSSRPFAFRWLGMTDFDKGGGLRHGYH